MTTGLSSCLWVVTVTSTRFLAFPNKPRFVLGCLCWYLPCVTCDQWFLLGEHLQTVLVAGQGIPMGWSVLGAQGSAVPQKKGLHPLQPPLPAVGIGVMNVSRGHGFNTSRLSPVKHFSQPLLASPSVNSHPKLRTGCSIHLSRGGK